MIVSPNPTAAEVLDLLGGSFQDLGFVMQGNSGRRIQDLLGANGVRASLWEMPAGIELRVQEEADVVLAEDLRQWLAGSTSGTQAPGFRHLRFEVRLEEVSEGA